MAVAHLKFVGVPEHIEHGDGLMSHELLKVVGMDCNNSMHKQKESLDHQYNIPYKYDFVRSMSVTNSGLSCFIKSISLCILPMS